MKREKKQKNICFPPKHFSQLTHLPSLTQRCHLLGSRFSRKTNQTQSPQQTVTSTRKATPAPPRLPFSSSRSSFLRSQIQTKMEKKPSCVSHCTTPRGLGRGQRTAGNSCWEITRSRGRGEKRADSSFITRGPISPQKSWFSFSIPNKKFLSLLKILFLMKVATTGSPLKPRFRPVPSRGTPLPPVSLTT